METVVQKYRKTLSKRFMSEQRREKVDTYKLISKELQKLRCVLDSDSVDQDQL